MPRERVLATVTAQVAELLGPVHAAVDPARPLVEVGISSLDFVQLAAAVGRDLGVKIPREELLRVSTLNDLIAAADRAVAAGES
jgi:acyl carrier protein